MQAKIWLLKYSIKALLPSIRRVNPFFYDITIVLKAEIIFQSF
jgi:hypothetical protein